ALLHDFMAYGVGFTGGVYVAAGDIDGDGNADLVTGAGAGGGPHVKVFSGADGSLMDHFMAYSANFQGGVRVALADVSSDGRADILVAPGAGERGRVAAFEGFTGDPLARFVAFPGSTAGVFVAGGMAVAVSPSANSAILSAGSPGPADFTDEHVSDVDSDKQWIGGLILPSLSTDDSEGLQTLEILDLMFSQL
ncbi:MAG: VCBS repeat-containing protein, partial [Pirellulales bacterium]